MAIEICSTKRKVRRFLSYDGEWVPGSLELRIIGVYDGNRYRSYPSVRTFLSAELSSENRGAWFFAHAGGLADVQFVLEELVKNPRYATHVVRASFSGSSAIIVRVTQGKNSWIFVDSYWLIRDKLSNIAKMIGMEKGGPDDDWSEEQVQNWYATVPFEELRQYNANDCIILWRAIDAFETALLSLGGQLQMTQASSAMQLFRRKYLTRRIETSDAINDKIDGSYFASRVEVFFRGEVLDSNYFDINSSFPFSMTFPCPGECIGVDRRLPVFEDRIFFSDVEFTVPDCYLTPIPIRAGGRLFFPSGRWRSWLSVVDIELLLREGGQVHKVYQTYHFEPFHDLAAFARDLYARRKATDDPVEKIVYKIMLNSVYGKYVESPEKSTIHIHPNERTLERLTFDDMLFPGAYEETLVVPVPHRWVPIGSHIVALSRATLYGFLGMTRHFHYCDTDGFSTTDLFPTGPNLGELKLEKKQKPNEVWRFVQAKLYRMGDKVKAKGFSLGWSDESPKKKQRAIELFEELLEGKDIQVTRMTRIRQNFMKGLVKPREEKVRKRVKDAMPKRCFDPKTGVSRPWTIKELKERGLLK